MSAQDDRYDLRGARWRKSSYSDSSSGECVEVADPIHPALSAGDWRKSTYSDANSGNCLEVADALAPAHIPVRDSKDPDGPALVFGAPAWTAFLDAVKADEFRQ